MPLVFMITLGLTKQSGFLSLDFFRASRNSRDRSMLCFIAAMVVPLGSLTSFRMPPYSIDQETVLPSSKSTKSSALQMRNSSKVIVGSSMGSLAPLWQKMGFFSRRFCWAFAISCLANAASMGLAGCSASTGDCVTGAAGGGAIGAAGDCATGAAGGCVTGAAGGCVTGAAGGGMTGAAGGGVTGAAGDGVTGAAGGGVTDAAGAEAAPVGSKGFRFGSAVPVPKMALMSSPSPAA